jgi:hypothetical protein
MLDHIGLQVQDVEAALDLCLRDPGGHPVDAVHSVDAVHHG